MQVNRREVKSGAGFIPDLVLAANGLMQIANLSHVTSDTNQADMFDQFAQILNVDLMKEEGGGLGFSIVDSPVIPGIFIAHVVADSPAKRAGLRVNDEIQLINEEDVESLDRTAAAVLLKTLPYGSVHLQVRRSDDITVIRSLQQFLVGLNYSRCLAEEIPTDAPSSRTSDTNGRVASRTKDSRNISDNAGHEERPPLSASSFDRGAIPLKEVRAPIGANISGSIDISLLSQQKEPQRVQFQHFPKNSELFPQTTQTRFHGLLFRPLFVMEIIVGLAVLVLECVTAGIFTAHIYGAEYAGIYVGAFAVISGAVGLWTSVVTVSVEKEHLFYWANLTLQCICLANSIGLLGASIALYLRHSNEKNGIELADYRIDLLIALKIAVFSLYIFLALFALAILVITVLQRREKRKNETIPN